MVAGMWSSTKHDLTSILSQSEERHEILRFVWLAGVQSTLSTTPGPQRNAEYLCSLAEHGPVILRHPAMPST